MNIRVFFAVTPSEELTALVAAARQHGVTFVYAISPGLDMTFSSSRDRSSLKRKLDQVAPRTWSTLMTVMEEAEPSSKVAFVSAR